MADAAGVQEGRPIAPAPLVDAALGRATDASLVLAMGAVGVTGDSSVDGHTTQGTDSSLIDLLGGVALDSQHTAGPAAAAPPQALRRGDSDAARTGYSQEQDAPDAPTAPSAAASQERYLRQLPILLDTSSSDGGEDGAPPAPFGGGPAPTGDATSDITSPFATRFDHVVEEEGATATGRPAPPPNPGLLRWRIYMDGSGTPGCGPVGAAIVLLDTATGCCIAWAAAHPQTTNNIAEAAGHVAFWALARLLSTRGAGFVDSQLTLRHFTGRNDAHKTELARYRDDARRYAKQTGDRATLHRIRGHDGATGAEPNLADCVAKRARQEQRSLCLRLPPPEPAADEAGRQAWLALAVEAKPGVWDPIAGGLKLPATDDLFPPLVAASATAANARVAQLVHEEAARPVSAAARAAEAQHVRAALAVPACDCRTAGKSGRHMGWCARQRHLDARKVKNVRTAMTGADTRVRATVARDNRLAAQQQQFEDQTDAILARAGVVQPPPPAGAAPLGPDGIAAVEAATAAALRSAADASHYAPVPAGFTYDAIAKLPLPTLKCIPGGGDTIRTVASALARICDLANEANTEALGWLLLYAFPKLVLGALPRGPGRTDESNAQVVRQRCAQLRTPNGYVELWEAANHTASARRGPTRPSEEDDPPSAAGPAGNGHGRPAARLDGSDRPGGDSDASGDELDLYAPPDGAVAAVAAAPAEQAEALAALWKDGELTGPVPTLLRHTIGNAPSVVSPQAKRRALQLATDGQPSRAAAATKGAKIAPPNDATYAQLCEKHPRAPPPVLPAEIPRTTIRFTPLLTQQSIMAMDAHSAPGPSGMRTIPLQQMARCPGSVLCAKLAPLFQRIVENRVPSEARDAIFSAALIAFLKKPPMPDVRPIACGEFMRRCAGRALLRKRRRPAAKHLLQYNQVAVGVRSGGEAVAHTSRRVVALWRADPVRYRTYVIVGTDVMNAFNKAMRAVFIRETCAHLPDLAQYTVAAYGAHKKLYYASTTISSEEGAMQGCPLGTLLYAMTQHAALREFREAHPGVIERLHLHGFFADDGNHGGEVADVAKFLKFFAVIARKYGIEFQPAKFTVACNLDALDEVRAVLEGAVGPMPRAAFRSWDQATLMGAAVGSDQAATAHMGRIADAAKDTFNRISQLDEPHQKTSTLLFCGNGLATYACRTSLPALGAVRRVEQALVVAVAAALGAPLTDAVEARLRLPLSQGGFGVRNTATYARVAFISAWAETHHLHYQLTNYRGIPLDADDLDVRAALAELSDVATRANDASSIAAIVGGHVDTCFAAARQAAAAQREGRLAEVPAILVGQAINVTPAAEAASGKVVAAAGGAGRKDAGTAPRRLQKQWSRLLDDELRESRLAAAGVAAPGIAATLNSCSVSHHGIMPLVDITRLGESVPWMKGPAFMRWARLRLGIPVYRQVDGVVGVCPKCRHPVSDQYAWHALSCMVSGQKQSLHKKMMGTISHLASSAMWNPLAEQRIFPSNGMRVDLLCRDLYVDPDDYSRLSVVEMRRRGRPIDTDALPVLPFPGGSHKRMVALDFTCVSPFTEHKLPIAARVPAGAAILAAAEKDDHYQTAVDEMGHYWLIPFAVDCFGGMEGRALKIIAELAK
ncbi:MAG: hypothetical protein AB7O67_23850, partial [Vicinamibacterales bacterium]